MSKYKVGDSVCFAHSLYGEVLHGKVAEIETRRGKIFYFVSCPPNCLGEYSRAKGIGFIYRKPEAQLFAKDCEAKAEWCKAEIARKKSEIKKLEKELKECLSK